MDDWAVGLLQQRISRLDGGQLPIVSFEVDRQLLHFIEILTSYTNTTFTGGTGPDPVLAPSDADELAATCRLLVDLGRGGGGLVAGPVDRARQQWVGTGNHTSLPDAVPTPTRTHLIEAAGPSSAQAKPFGLGLYTSTEAADGRGMWRTYLESIRGSTLHPPPWYTWNLHAREDVTVAEITSAREWTTFVEAYARTHAGMVYPDWRNVARDFDGVHMTLRAILAIQGFRFPTSLGPTAPAYWDVESTLWLRWCFTSVSLREAIDG